MNLFSTEANVISKWTNPLRNASVPTFACERRNIITRNIVICALLFGHELRPQISTRTPVCKCHPPAAVAVATSLDGHTALVDGCHTTSGGSGGGGSRLVPPPLLNQLGARRVRVLDGEGLVIDAHLVQRICHLLLHLRPRLVLVLQHLSSEQRCLRHRRVLLQMENGRVSRICTYIYVDIQ